MLELKIKNIAYIFFLALLVNGCAGDGAQQGAELESNSYGEQGYDQGGGEEGYDNGGGNEASNNYGNEGGGNNYGNEGGGNNYGNTAMKAVEIITVMKKHQTTTVMKAARMVTAMKVEMKLLEEITTVTMMLMQIILLRTTMETMSRWMMLVRT